MKQTKARIFGNDPHFSEKIVSIFEPKTEVIRKGKASKPTEFGKMVKIQEAENQIITSYEVYEKKPNDSDLLVKAVEEHCQRLGQIPNSVRVFAGRRSYCDRSSNTG
jgi:IS5 family transposase